MIAIHYIELWAVIYCSDTRYGQKNPLSVLSCADQIIAPYIYFELVKLYSDSTSYIQKQPLYSA